MSVFMLSDKNIMAYLIILDIFVYTLSTHNKTDLQQLFRDVKLKPKVLSVAFKISQAVFKIP